MYLIVNGSLFIEFLDLEDNELDYNKDPEITKRLQKGEYILSFMSRQILNKDLKPIYKFQILEVMPDTTYEFESEEDY